MFLHRPRLQTLGELLKLGDVTSESDSNRFPVGGHDIAPNIEGTKGQARAVYKSRTEDAGFGLRAAFEQCRQSSGSKLRQMRGVGHDLVVFPGTQNYGESANFLDPANKIPNLRALQFNVQTWRQDVGASDEQISLSRFDAPPLAARHGMPTQELAARDRRSSFHNSTLRTTCICD